MVKLKAIREQILDCIQKQFNERDAKVEELAKMVLYTYAVPQIKGNITKGKLKWR